MNVSITIQTGVTVEKHHSFDVYKCSRSCQHRHSGSDRCELYGYHDFNIALCSDKVKEALQAEELARLDAMREDEALIGDG